MKYIVVIESNIVRVGDFGSAAEAKLRLNPDHTKHEVMYVRVGNPQMAPSKVKHWPTFT